MFSTNAALPVIKPKKNCSQYILIPTRKALTDYILKFGNLTIEQTDFIAGKATRVTLPKGEYFSEAGKIPRQVAFVLDGIIRWSFTTTKAKKSPTISFMEINSL